MNPLLPYHRSQINRVLKFCHVFLCTALNVDIIFVCLFLDWICSIYPMSVIPSPYILLYKYLMVFILSFFLFPPSLIFFIGLVASIRNVYGSLYLSIIGTNGICKIYEQQIVRNKWKQNNTTRLTNYREKTRLTSYYSQKMYIYICLYGSIESRTT